MENKNDELKEFLDEIGKHYEDYCIEGTSFNKENANEVRDLVFNFYKHQRKSEASLVESYYK